MQARACYTCEHVLPPRASTCFLHVRARYLFVRARLLFKNVRPGQLKRHWSKEYQLILLEKVFCWFACEPRFREIPDHLYNVQCVSADQVLLTVDDLNVGQKFRQQRSSLSAGQRIRKCQVLLCKASCRVSIFC